MQELKSTVSLPKIDNYQILATGLILSDVTINPPPPPPSPPSPPAPPASVRLGIHWHRHSSLVKKLVYS